MIEIDFQKVLKVNLLKKMTHGLLDTYKLIKKKTKKNR